MIISLRFLLIVSLLLVKVSGFFNFFLLGEVVYKSTTLSTYSHLLLSTTTIITIYYFEVVLLLKKHQLLGTLNYSRFLGNVRI